MWITSEFRMGLGRIHCVKMRPSRLFTKAHFSGLAHSKELGQADPLLPGQRYITVQLVHNEMRYLSGCIVEKLYLEVGLENEELRVRLGIQSQSLRSATKQKSELASVQRH
jgi:hypothetical protein